MVHQCAQLSENTIKPHGEDVNRIGRYVKVTDKMGICIRPRDSDIKVWEDDCLSSNCFPEDAKDDSDTARSCSVFVVSCLSCTVMWKLQLQTEISLSSTES